MSCKQNIPYHLSDSNGRGYFPNSVAMGYWNKTLPNKLGIFLGVGWVEGGGGL